MKKLNKAVKQACATLAKDKKALKKIVKRCYPKSVDAVEHKVYHTNLTCYCGKKGTLVSKLGDNSGKVKCIKCGEEYFINVIIREELIPVKAELPIL